MTSIVQHKWLSVVLAITIAIPSSIFAQAANTSMTHEEAILEAEKFADEQRLIEEYIVANEDEIRTDMILQNTKASLLDTVYYSFFSYFVLWSRDSLFRAHSSQIQAAVHPFMEMSDIEVLFHEESLFNYMKVRYLGSTPEETFGLKRFEGLNRLFDTLDQKLPVEVANFNINFTQTTNMSAVEFFKTTMQTLVNQNKTFNNNTLVSMIRCLAFSHHLDLYLEKNTFSNFAYAVRKHGFNKMFFSIMDDRDGKTFHPDHFQNFDDVLQRAAKANYSDVISWVQAMKKSKIKSTSATILESHMRVLEQRGIAHKKLSSPTTKIRIFKSMAMGLAAGIFLFIMRQKSINESIDSILDKYNVSSEQTIKMLYNDPETYSMFLKEDKEFAIGIATFARNYHAQKRKAQEDIRFLNQLANNQRN